MALFRLSVGSVARTVQARLRQGALITGLCLFALSLRARASGGPEAEIVLANDVWTVTLQPASLGVAAKPTHSHASVVSAPLSDLGPIRGLSRTTDRVSWELPDQNVVITVSLQRRDLSVQIRSAATGHFTCPVLELSQPVEALIWPYWEGRYIPLDDSQWIDFLIERGPWDTLSGLCMPFWGCACADYTLTFIVTNRYNNSIRFSREGDSLRARFTHEFPPSKSEWGYGFVIRLSESVSPVEPARQFRHWLIEQGRFVTLAEKIKSIPKVERLLGAAHVYLWGDALLTRHDIKPTRWQAFCKTLISQNRAAGPSPGKRIKNLMYPEHWKHVAEIATLQWPGNYIKSEVTNELSRLLQRADFFDKASWKQVSVPAEAATLLARDPSRLPLPELCRLNCRLLEAAYPGTMLPVDDWGDGVSVKMLRRFQEAGFDRMRFCVDGVAAVEKRPGVARAADAMGYLFGTYDSFHSIHDPATRRTDATWNTAQFDRALWKTGPIVGKDGEKISGFQGRGYKLSPHAARPYVETRVNQNMEKVPFNYYFVDCDAYGEVYDDYSLLHPSSQEQGAQARLDRLAWIRDTHQVVIGSEGGSSYAAPVVHVIEGMLGPVFGWNDPDLRDRESPYYRGGYYPPDGPRVFLKPVPLKEKYRYLHYDPRFRLPLNEIVFHDSFVSTHHWGNGSLKHPDIADTVALTEVLYQCPPLYHMNLDEFKKHRLRMKKHYDFFSPIHREVRFAPMTDFAWLSPDRRVQRTVFGNRLEIIVNFGTIAFDQDGRLIPPHTAAARWLESGEERAYTPGP